MTAKGALSALEAAFLYAETPITPMHVGSLGIFDATGWRGPRGRLRVPSLRSHIAERARYIPRLGQRPRWPPGRSGRPVWVEDTDFDISRHVRTMTLPPPGNPDQLSDAVASLHMTLLDRDHPLWELWFVDGLEGGGVAMVEKLHHAMVDGIGGVDLAMMLLEAEPAPSTPAGEPPVRHRPPSELSLLGGVAAGAAREPLTLGHDVLEAAAHPLRAATAAAHLAEAAGDVASRLLAPRSSLNAEIGSRRCYRTLALPLAPARAAAHALGGTVNDLVLCAVSHGLNALLLSRGEPTASPLHALVPVSLRTRDEHQVLGNRVAAMIVPLATGPAALAERFERMRTASRDAKAHHQAELTTSLLAAPEHWPEPLLAAFSRLVHRQPFVNLVVTNVPGPPVPLYLMGSRMTHVFPVVPLARNLDVSVGILSYVDELALGVWADRDRFGDIDVLVAGIRTGFDGLAALAAEKAGGHAAAPA